MKFGNPEARPAAEPHRGGSYANASFRAVVYEQVRA